MDSRINRKKPVGSLSRLPWWVWIAAIDVFFVAITILIPYLPESIRYGPHYHFNLAVEMNAGAWWSSTSLLMLALLAYELFSSRQDGSRPAWLVLSAILFLLSWDEIGSLHERAGGFNNLLPVIFVFILVLAYALGVLFRMRETRKTTIWIAVAFGLLGSVVLQERLEHAFEWPMWMAGIRVGIEEGSELLAFLLIWAGLVMEKQKTLPIKTLLVAIPDPQQMKSLVALLLGGLLAHSALSILTALNYEVSNLGNPAIWYPVALFALIFLTAVWNSVDAAGGRQWVWYLLAVYALLNSLAAVYIVSPRQEISGFNSLGWISNPYFFYAIQIGALAILFISLFRFEARKDGMIFGLLAAALVLGLLVGGLATQFIFAGVITFLMNRLFLNGFSTDRVTIPEDVTSIQI